MQLVVSAVIGIALSFISSLLRPKQHAKKNTEDALTDSAFGTPLERGWGSTSHVGTLIWRGPRTEREEEVGGKGGGGGGTKWTYSQSFAMAFCTGPRDSVVKIWKNKAKLIYDSASGLSTGKADITFHKGDEEQTPDPTIEAILGAGNVPAYRGLCYIVFKNLDTTEDGGRLPDITAEIIGTPGLHGSSVDPDEDSVGYQRLAVSDISSDIVSVSDFKSDPSSEFIYGISDSGLTKIDVSTDTEVYSGFPFNPYYIVDRDVDDSGHIWVIDWETSNLGTGGEARLIRINSNTMSAEPSLTLSTPFLTIAGDNKQWERVCAIGNNFVVTAVSGVRAPSYPTNSNAQCCLAVYQYSWNTATQSHTISEIVREYFDLCNLQGLERFAVTKSSSESFVILNNPPTLVKNNSGTFITYSLGNVAATNVFYVSANNELAMTMSDHSMKFWKLSDNSWNETELALQGSHVVSSRSSSDMLWCQLDSASGYGLNKINLVQRINDRTIVSVPSAIDCYVSSIDSFYSPDDSNHVGKYGFTTKEAIGDQSTGRIFVSDLILDICAMAGIHNVNASNITDTVTGFKSPGRVSPRADLEVLAKAFMLEKVDMGRVMKIQKRYPSTMKPVVEIDYDELAAHEVEQDPPFRLKHSILAESEFPKEVIVQSIQQKYISPAVVTTTAPVAINGLMLPFMSLFPTGVDTGVTGYYEKGGERAFRAATTSQLSETHDLTQLVTDEAERKLMANRILSARWAERHVYEFSTYKKYCRLKPGDMVRITTPDEDAIIHLTKVTLGNPGIIKCEGIKSAYDVPYVEPVSTNLCSTIYTHSWTDESGNPWVDPRAILSDGNLSTSGGNIYENPTGTCMQNVKWAKIDFIVPRRVGVLRLYLANSFVLPDMQGGKFQGSDAGEDSVYNDDGWTTLANLSDMDPPASYPGWSQGLEVDSPDYFKYYRVWGMNGSGNTVLTEWQMIGY